MFVYHPDISLSLGQFGIGIPMLHERITKMVDWLEVNAPRDILDKSIWTSKVFHPIDQKLLLSVHNKEFVDNSFNNPSEEIIKTYELIDEDGNPNRYYIDAKNLPLEQLHNQILCHMQASLEATQFALKNKWTFFLGGGLHHAMTFGGRGFCHYNDIAVNAKYLINEHSFSNIWVIDVDAHKGDGTAEIFKDNSFVHTLSIHQENSWPLDLAKFNEHGGLNPWFIPSDIDIPINLQNNSEYNKLLEDGIDEMNRKFPNPDFIFIAMGSDPYEHDVLPSTSELKLSLEQMFMRDKLLYDNLSAHKSPMLFLVSGGYGPRAHEPYIEFFKYLLDRI